MNTETETAKAHAVEMLERLTAGRKLHTLTTYGRGETDYVRVFVAADDGEIHEVTWYVAAFMGGRKIKAGAGIPMGGGQYSKGLEIADWARRAIGQPLDQTNDWREL